MSRFMGRLNTDAFETYGYPLAYDKRAAAYMPEETMGSAGLRIGVHPLDKQFMQICFETLAGNCGVAHLCHLVIHGYTKAEEDAILAWAERICIGNKYTIVTAGLNQYQQHLKDLLRRNGWSTMVDVFTSRRTHANCELFYKNLGWSKEEYDIAMARRSIDDFKGVINETHI